MSNKNTYENSEIVNEYVAESCLQAPEKIILELLKKKNIQDMTMLDIGVGGGRTTLYFANLVKRYIGIDYSQEMIDACKIRFKDELKNKSFQFSDVRDMKNFSDNTFDFILFSFNGLDYISHEDRLIALKEIHRVAKPGAYFCFSTHNQLCVPRIFYLRKQFSMNPKHMLVNMYYWFFVRFVYNRKININKLEKLDYSIFNDGGHNFQLQTYYIKPMEQIKQLEGLGKYNQVKVFSLNSGLEIKREELQSKSDRWLYYLCKINK